MFIDKWANFLFNEKLRPDNCDLNILLSLAESLAEIRGPCIKTHKDKLESRKLVCQVAISLGIDLMAVNSRMGRGLLDAWNKELTAQFGSVVGTNSIKEAARRNVKIKLGKLKLLKSQIKIN